MPVRAVSHKNITLKKSALVLIKFPTDSCIIIQYDQSSIVLGTAAPEGKLYVNEVEQDARTRKRLPNCALLRDQLSIKKRDCFDTREVG